MNNEEKILQKLDDLDKSADERHVAVVQRLTNQETLMQTLVGPEGVISNLKKTQDKHSGFISYAKGAGAIIGFLGLGGIAEAISHLLKGK